ncbi:peptidase G2 autoproteolytic cleavage domain-containing protein [Niallia taxi]|uniref:peptidase G2 autoproteolytic cleavage domain-containing protein n=1 Tax=Niallia taxi TaxID=2499688 RepID=UPI003180E904
MSWDDDINIYNDPIVFLSRKGDATDPYKHITETVQIVNGYAPLREVPEKTYKVKVTSEDKVWYEVEDEALTDNFFQVDYIQGVVFFTAENNNKSVTFEYYGKGGYYTPDSRMYLTGDSKFRLASHKFKDLDRADLEQKNRVDELIVGNPQPMEVVDLRIDRNGRVYKVARDRINAIQEAIEDTFLGDDGRTYTSLKQRLDTSDETIEGHRIKIEEFVALSKKISKRVALIEFEHLIPNKNVVSSPEYWDWTEAIKAALGNGNVELYAPAGTYRTRQVNLPSYTHIYGDGFYNTIFKLIESAPVNEFLFTNSDWVNGNSYIRVADLQLDWNRARLGSTYEIPAGPTSSGLMFANTQYAWVNRVFSKDAGLHGFDITSPEYNRTSGQSSPTYYQPKGCKNIWLDGCISTGSGDDNFTTHFSEYIYINNCLSYDPLGNVHEEGSANTNCFEIDDGSKYVWVTNCRAIGGVRGFEVKAHNYAPAARYITLDNCTSIGSIRAFDLRHIGHHTDDDPVSTTAFDVTLNNCTAINPKSNSLYQSLKPRALIISAYRNVNISNFTAIGDSSGLTTGDSVIVFQYKSGFINAENIKVSGFKNADNDIYITGGSQRADNININNFVSYESATNGVYLGSQVLNADVSKVSLYKTSNTGTGYISVNSQNNIQGLSVTGYAKQATIADVDYTTPPSRIRNGTVVASSSGAAKSDTAFIAASTSNSVASGSKNAILSSSNVDTTGEYNAIISSSGDSTLKNIRGAIIASNGSKITGTDIFEAIVLASNNVINPKSNTVAMGHGWTPSTSNRNIEFDAANGTVKATGTITGSSSFSDYAEYFESLDGKSIPTGTLVTLDQGLIRVAKDGDDMLGVISETAGSVLGESSFYWQGKYLRNDFGGLIYEEVVITEVNADTGLQTKRKAVLPKENPNYKDTDDYLPRSERPEWNVVGLVGQVYIKIDSTVKQGDYIKASEGIATKSVERGQGWRVMKITKPFIEENGFGIALVFIR